VKSTVVVLTSLTLITGLSACSTTPQSVEYSARPINRPELILPEANTLDLREVDFVVVNRDNIEQIFSQLEREGKPVVLFALTDENYQNLSLNIADIMELLSQQKAIIIAYSQYQEGADAAIAAHNNNRSVTIPVTQDTKTIKDFFSFLKPAE
jgi:acetolactate synthase small subunit